MAQIYKFQVKWRGSERSAFTIVELIVVLTIVATLAGLATTAFITSFEARSTDHFVKELTAYLRFVQSKAIEEGKTHKLVTEEPNGALSVLVQDEAASEFHPLDNLFSKRFENEKRFSVHLAQGNEIYFFPDGMITRNKLMVSDEKGEHATIEIKNRVGAFKVILNE